MTVPGPPTRVVRGVLITLAGAAGMTAPLGAFARDGGIVTDVCSGCHKGGSVPTVTITPAVLDAEAGEIVRLEVVIDGGPDRVGGLYLEPPGIGSLLLVAGQGTQLLFDGVAHESPRQESGGRITFLIDWQAPDGRGGAGFSVAAVSGDGDDRSNNDGAANAYASVAFGCAEGTTYYRDLDGDGWARDGGGWLRACAPPPGYASERGDCDDNDRRRAPGNPEICNGIDDDCDGVADEDLEAVELHPDGDGDGWGRRGETTETGCGARAGWGVGTGDCDDDDETIHPEAVELCNLIDDDCDGDVDDGARTFCGVGWCRRESYSCVEGSCEPGEPSPEACNYLDDDCDGEIDEDRDLCPSGWVCELGVCVFDPQADDDTTGGDPDPGRGEGPNPDSDPGSEPGAGGEGAGAPDSTASGGCTLDRTPLWLVLVLAPWLGRRRGRPLGRSQSQSQNG